MGFIFLGRTVCIKGDFFIRPLLSLAGRFLLEPCVSQAIFYYIIIGDWGFLTTPSELNSPHWEAPQSDTVGCGISVKFTTIYKIPFRKRFYFNGVCLKWVSRQFKIREKRKTRLGERAARIRLATP